MKTTTANKNTRIQRLIDRYESNRLFIQRVAIVPDQQYQETLCETGLTLLEDIYPRNSEYEEYYQEHSKSKQFWGWFKAEWMKWESELVTFIIDHKPAITNDFWQTEMTQMALDRNTQNSYYNNYLKQVKNEI